MKINTYYDQINTLSLPNYIISTRSDIANYFLDDTVSTGTLLDVIRNNVFYEDSGVFIEDSSVILEENKNEPIQYNEW